MPLYRYNPCTNTECTREKLPFELRKLMSQYKDPGECPACGELCERIPNDFSRHAKCVGPGWMGTTGSYATDPRQINKDIDTRIASKNSSKEN